MRVVRDPCSTHRDGQRHPLRMPPGPARPPAVRRRLLADVARACALVVVGLVVARGVLHLADLIGLGR